MRKLFALFTLVSFIFLSNIVCAQTDLVGYWKLDEGLNNKLTDSSGLGNNGTITNLDSGIVWDTGKYGNSLKFLGTNGYANIPNSSSLDFSKTNSLTMSLWLKVESESRQDIISSGWWWNKDGFNIEYGVSPGYLALRGCFGGNDVGDHNYFYFKPYVGIWTHVVFTFESDISRLYINGMKVVEKSEGGSLCFNNNKAVKIGGNHYYLNGSVDEVKIYFRALSDVEIREDQPTINDNEKLSFSYGNLSDTISYESIDYNERSYKISLRTDTEINSKNITICSNAFDLIKIPNAIPEGSQNIPDMSYWNFRFLKNGIDDTNNWKISSLGVACRDYTFSSADFNVIASINPKIKIIANYNQLKSVSNMSYGVQILSASGSFKNDWINGGPNQSLWNLVKDLNFSFIRIFDESMPLCTNWDSVNHKCNNWNWNATDPIIKNIINIGMEPMISFYVDWSNSNGVPGMTINWNNTLFPNPEDFGNYASEIVKHYNVDPYQYNIRYWEVLNEPPVSKANSDNLTAFVKMYNKFREKIKAVDPSALTGMNYISYKTFFDFIVDNSVDLDFGTIHIYEGSSGKNNLTFFEPPNDKDSYYTDSTIMNKVNNFHDYSLEQMRSIWKQKRGKDIEIFNSESDLTYCGSYLCDPRQNNIFGATWYAARSKSLILNGSTNSIFFQLSSYHSFGNPFGSFGHGLIKGKYPYVKFATYWTNYLLTHYVPKGSLIYDSTSNNPSFVDVLAVKTEDSNNVLLINKMNVSSEVRIPILGLGVKNATLYLLDQNSYKWYYDVSIKDVLITSNISTIELDKNNVQNIKLNGYSVGILQTFTDPSMPYVKSVTSDLLSSFYNYSENMHHVLTECSGTNSIEVYSSKKPVEVKFHDVVIQYDDNLSVVPSWKYSEISKIITVKFIC